MIEITRYDELGVQPRMVDCRLCLALGRSFAEKLGLLEGRETYVGL